MLRTFDFQKVPIVDILNEILVDSAKRGASDIHFDPQNNRLLIRIRIDGILYDYAEVPANVKDYLITRIKTISRLNITESRLPQDGAIKDTILGKDLDLRVSSLPVSGGEKVVIRILDYTMSMAGLSELSFSESNYKKILDMISVPNGIILVTGATGSGKSTTVYSILQYLNTSETNIITVEDPIEMDIAGINQVQTNSKIGLTFATALRSILRQDPNIIMIGEIRDTETARIAVRASITGHLVLSTLHTNTALNTIERLIDMEVQKYLLASALEGVVSQKLARRLCNNCKKKRPTTNYERNVFKNVLGKDVLEIYDVEGCDQCNDGFKGRIPIHEVLKINQKIRDALSEDASKEAIRNLVYSEADVTTMLQDGLQKVLDGHTSFGEIVKLIELEDDDQVSGDTSFKDALSETKAALAAQLQKDNSTTPISNSGGTNLNNAPVINSLASVQNPQTQPIEKLDLGLNLDNNSKFFNINNDANISGTGSTNTVNNVNVVPNTTTSSAYTTNNSNYTGNAYYTNSVPNTNTGSVQNPNYTTNINSVNAYATNTNYNAGTTVAGNANYNTAAYPSNSGYSTNAVSNNGSNADIGGGNYSTVSDYNTSYTNIFN